MHHAGLELRTQRTLLTPFADDDAGQLLDLFREPKVRGYLLDDVVVSPAWVLNEIEQSQERFARGSAGLWSVRLDDDADVIGFVGFREFFHPPELQLLYGLLPAHWGGGLATEVTTAVCDFVFRRLGFDEITAATDLPNRASARVLQRLGMQFVRATDAGAAGTALFALERDAWLQREGRAGEG
ncbi:MAG: GNAT family N-acetyltransferase [Planctomycetes bacterium]|nr:GNAT family N-acetyltransferase [Planctomycetota bacterium]